MIFVGSSTNIRELAHRKYIKYAETGSDLRPKIAIPWCRKMAASILKSEATWRPETIWRGLGFSSDSSIATECVRIHGRDERIARRPAASRYDTLPHRSASGDCPGAMAYVTRSMYCVMRDCSGLRRLARRRLGLAHRRATSATRMSMPLDRPVGSRFAS
jgi:hypothetical protein